MNATVRFTVQFPCPICGGHAALPQGRGIRCYGFLSSDGDYAHCTRDELAGTLTSEANGTYAHRLVGDCRCGGVHGSPHAPHARDSASERRGGHRDEVPVWRDPAWHRTHVFPYHRADGTLAYRVLRWERYDKTAKRFFQERPDPTRPGYPWASGLGDTPRVPYRLPQLLSSPRSAPVLIPEGEKQVDLLRSWGYVATCNAEGARRGAWRPELSPSLADRHIVLLPDNDPPRTRPDGVEVLPDGLRHIYEVGAALLATAASVRVLLLPDLPPHGDVMDYAQAGGDADTLRREHTVPFVVPATQAADAGGFVSVLPSGLRVIAATSAGGGAAWLPSH